MGNPTDLNSVVRHFLKSVWIRTSDAVRVMAGGSIAPDAAVTGNPVLVGARASTAVPTAVNADGDAVFLWSDREGAFISVGNRDHDAVDAGKPLKVGARALTSPKGMTLVSNADRTDNLSDSDGFLFVKPWTSGADRVSERVANTNGTSTAFANFTAVASTYNNITDVAIFNSNVSTSGYVDFRNGTAGSIMWTFPAPANGGCVMHFDPPLKQPSTNTALAYDVSAAISTVYISVNGFQSKV